MVFFRRSKKGWCSSIDYLWRRKEISCLTTSMKIDFKTSFPENSSTLDLLVIPIAPAPALKGKQALDLLAPEVRESLKRLDTQSNGCLSKFLKRSEFKPSGTERIDLQLARKDDVFPILLGGISKEALSEPLSDEWRKLGGAAFRSAVRQGLSSLTISLHSVSKPILTAVVRATCEGIYLADYNFSKYKSEKPPAKKLVQVNFLLREKETPQIKAAAQEALLVSKCVNFARNLVNTPPIDLLPKDVVAAAREIKGRAKKSKLKIHGPVELKKMKAELILAVAAGSTSSPYLIHLAKDATDKKNAKKIVLVGKGVTFDSGGLSIKPAKGMEDMKCDMSGAAAVLAAFEILSSLNLKNIELHAVVPTTENSVSGASIRPGDIVKSMHGKSVEILNTDAEGRLILADALTYTAKLKPDYIIDLATLTGACIVALGDEYAGLFTRDELLRDQIIAAGKDAGELYWPLPLAKEYKGQLKSQFADLRNIGAGSGAGASIGALFLEEFIPEGTKWAHLDIAGPAYVSKGGDYSIPGGTGFGTRTLVALVERLARG